MSFSQNLASLRKQANLSQEKLAEQLGVTRQAVSKWESGLSSPDLDMVVRLCEILNVTSDQLLTGTAPQSNKAKAALADNVLLPILITVFMSVVFISGVILLLFYLVTPYIHASVAIIGLICMFLSAICFCTTILWKLCRKKKK